MFETASCSRKIELVKNLVKLTPILRSMTCLASTLKLTFLSAYSDKLSKAAFKSFLVNEENLALKIC